MAEVRTFRRKVMMKLGTRADAERVANQLANPVNPDVEVGEYAVEYTPVANQREPWRVIHISDVPDGTPDIHPYCERLIKGAQGQLNDAYEDPWW